MLVSAWHEHVQLQSCKICGPLPFVVEKKWKQYMGSIGQDMVVATMGLLSLEEKFA
jgi:hypothetical protein